MKKQTLIAFILSQFIANSWADSAFVVRKIDIEGLQRTSNASIMNIIPIKPGQTLAPEETAAIVRALYKTGHFERITLSRNENTLVIHVTERPTIGQLKITGNSLIPTDKLTAAMKSLDVAEGRVYNPEVLEKIRKTLLSQYLQQGYYNARVDVTSSSMSRNRVEIKMAVSEGQVAKIKSIHIIGNHAFDEAVLIKESGLSTGSIFSFFTHSDRYSEEKLEAALEKIRAYYLDRGYIRFEIKSHQAVLAPDKKSAVLNIVVEEYQPYTIKEIRLAGNNLLPKEEVLKQITIKPGEIFSRAKVIASESAISKLYGQNGYVFSSISLHPEVNEQTKEVVIVFVVSEGKRAYVRHITFSENHRTNDIVLRREVVQWEGAPIATNKLDESKHRLSLLPFIGNVDMSVNPVADHPELVDVNYKVEEKGSAQATFKIGYSQLYRFLVGIAFDQKNFFGTGNTLGVNLTRSKYEQFYGIDFTNPYYTEDGISRGFNFSYSKVDPGAAGASNGYTTNQYNLGVLYGIPIGQEDNVFNRLQAGIGLQSIVVNLNSTAALLNPAPAGAPTPPSAQVLNYVNQHGRRFTNIDLKLGYVRDSRDRAIFPTNGGIQTLYLDAFVPVANKSVSYYNLNYHGRWYHPIIDQFIFTSRANFGYGNAFHGVLDYPFYSYYYAGGIESVRGYQGFSLGPRDSNNNPLGGNLFVDGSLGLIFPNHISDNLRTSVFFDAGNVYSTYNNARKFGGNSTNSGPLRYSVGVQADFYIPMMGPISISLAAPIKRRPNDEREVFQFELGANF